MSKLGVVLITMLGHRHGLQRPCSYELAQRNSVMVAEKDAEIADLQKQLKQTSQKDAANSNSLKALETQVNCIHCETELHEGYTIGTCCNVLDR